ARPRSSPVGTHHRPPVTRYHGLGTYRRRAEVKDAARGSGYRLAFLGLLQRLLELLASHASRRQFLQVLPDGGGDRTDEQEVRPRHPRMDRSGRGSRLRWFWSRCLLRRWRRRWGAGGMKWL